MTKLSMKENFVCQQHFSSSQKDIEMVQENVGKNNLKNSINQLKNTVYLTIPVPISQHTKKDRTACLQVTVWKLYFLHEYSC